MAQTVRVGAWSQLPTGVGSTQATENPFQPSPPWNDSTLLFRWRCAVAGAAYCHFITGLTYWDKQPFRLTFRPTGNRVSSVLLPWVGTVWEETHRNTGERANSTMEGCDPEPASLFPSQIKSETKCYNLVHLHNYQILRIHTLWQKHLHLSIISITPLLQPVSILNSVLLILAGMKSQLVHLEQCRSITALCTDTF